METDTVAEMEDVGEWVWGFPAFGETRLHVEVLIAAQQGVENQLVDALRWAVRAHARVQISWAALDDHH